MTVVVAFALMFMVLIAVGVGFADEQVDYPTPIDTVTPQTMQKWMSRHGGAAYPNDWVTSPPCPIAVRQNHTDGPTYQEAVGYTFLIHSMKRPRMTRLESGRLVLVATAWLNKQNEETPFVITSDDKGQSWSQPRQEPVHGELVSLGGDKVASISSTCSFSDDGGDAWTEPKPLTLPDGRPQYGHGSVAFDGK